MNIMEPAYPDNNWDSIQMHQNFRADVVKMRKNKTSARFHSLLLLRSLGEDLWVSSSILSYPGHFLNTQ